MPDLSIERSVRTRAVEVGSRRLDVTVASLRARLGWTGARSAGGFGFAVATPVAVTGARVDSAVVPWFGRGLSGLLTAALARRLTVESRELHEEHEEEDRMPELGRVGNLVGGAARPEEMVKALTTVASGAGAVGPVTTAGDRSVVPLVETMFSGGYGGGGGGGTSPGDGEEGLGGGGGGGGAGRSRTVAVVEVAPEGVTIRPVIDKTAITLAVISGAFGLLTAFVRRRR